MVGQEDMFFASFDWEPYAREFFAIVLKEHRLQYGDKRSCPYCKNNNGTDADGKQAECKGFHTDDCFELDMQKWYAILEEKSNAKGKAV